MGTTTRRARRVLGAVFAGSAAGGAAVALMGPVGMPAATAAPDPCSASEVAKTVGSVATSMGSYLDSHPETNAALTAISRQEPGPQSIGALKSYFDANPQAAKDMQRLQSPLSTLSARCDLPLTLPQVLGLMQSAQSQGAAQGSLPAGLPSAQNVSVPGTAAPAQVTPAGPGVAGRGPLPGPVTRSAG